MPEAGKAPVTATLTRSSAGSAKAAFVTPARRSFVLLRVKVARTLAIATSSAPRGLLLYFGEG